MGRGKEKSQIRLIVFEKREGKIQNTKKKKDKILKTKGYFSTGGGKEGQGSNVHKGGGVCKKGKGGKEEGTLNFRSAALEKKGGLPYGKGGKI